MEIPAPVQVPTHWYNIVADLAGYEPEQRKPAKHQGRHGLRPQLPSRSTGRVSAASR